MDRLEGFHTIETTFRLTRTHVILLEMLEQTVKSDQRGVPKEYTREIKLLYKKFVKVAEKVELELSN